MESQAETAGTRTLTETRPRQATILGWLTVIHVYRVAALGLVLTALEGGVPPVFIIPGVGDFLAGITAPIIAFLLWRRRGLRVWLAAIVWHALALSDLLVGQSIQFIVQPESGITPPDAVLAIALTIWIALDITHLLSIVLLSRKPMRDYYLQVRSAAASWLPEDRERTAGTNDETEPPSSTTPRDLVLWARPHGGPCPLAATIAIVLTAIHTYRVIALNLTVAALRGDVPLVFVIGGVGDLMIGITAPLIVFALWRRGGLGVWTAAIVWHALAIADFVMGQGLIAAVDAGVASLSPPRQQFTCSRRCCSSCSPTSCHSSSSGGRKRETTTSL